MQEAPCKPLQGPFTSTPIPWAPHSSKSILGAYRPLPPHYQTDRETVRWLPIPEEAKDMEAFDEDWRKARGFLITFSFDTLLAWYFSADLGKLPIAGASLTIKANAEDVWLVIAAVNIYFILRCIQKFPPEKKLPDNATREGFEKTLIWLTDLVYRDYYVRYIEMKNREFPAQRKSRHTTIIEILPRSMMLYKFDLANQDENSPLYQQADQLRLLHGNTIRVSLPYSYESNDGESGVSSGYNLDLTPNLYTILFAKIVGWPRGLIFTPWMTDYIFPLLLGLGSTAAALYTWTHNPAV